MTGGTDLQQLIAGMRPELMPGVFVFVTTQDVTVAGLPARMRFEEAEGTTLIMTAEEAAQAGLAGSFRSRMITLNVHSSLEAVGFLARIATRLAAEGMGVNPVAGFYHDHLFVPEDRAEDAMETLREMAATAR
ncbi:ACT domain-containing protein [Jannaschia sp. 2305UL9-9]|uniref:ACT domain-containing protein n=1 Tax=Jannaschia sp. 2305UL9-9 TaxID=3121638 RepID=UPI00352914F6